MRLLVASVVFVSVAFKGGLDNLVPHYIFIRNDGFAAGKVEAYEDIKKCPVTDTKTLSMLCEKGYSGFDLDLEKNLLFRR